MINKNNIDNQNLKSKFKLGLIWSSAHIIINQVLRFCILIILARLLEPKDFGLIGMLTIFISISQILVDSGLSNALIRKKEVSNDEYNTVFYINIGFSFIIYFLLFISSDFISRYYDENILSIMIKVLGLVVIINSISIIQRTILVREIEFKKQAYAGILASFISGIVAIILAILGYGVWSLVVQNILLALIQTLILLRLNKWIPSLKFDISSFKELYSFSWKITCSSLIYTVYQNTYLILIGRFYSSSTLGYYTTANKLRDVASQSITTAIQKVSFPVLSSLQENDKNLKAGYKKIIIFTAIITFPIMMYISAFSEEIIVLLMGEKWLKSGYFLSILSLAGMLFPLHAINLNMLQVKGRSDLFLGLEILKTVIGSISLAVVIFMNLGIKGIVYAVLFNSIASFFINAMNSKKILNYSTKEQLKDIFPVFTITFISITIIKFIFEKDIISNKILELFLSFFVYSITFFITGLIYKKLIIKKRHNMEVTNNE